MPDIFYKMFLASNQSVIKFLSNKSNFFEDIAIISRCLNLFFKRTFKKKIECLR